MATGTQSAPAEGPDAGAQSPHGAIRITDLAKRFGPVKAIRHAEFDIHAGEVHVLMGENGSGKSTLVKILSGVQIPDRGTVTIGGVTTKGFSSPRAARAAGIITVFQEVLTADGRTVLENVWVGIDGLVRNRIPAKIKRERATAVLDELLGYVPDLNGPVAELSLSERQACVIARALVASPKLLILDEATSALDVATRDRLLAIITRLSAEGVSTLFISHRMDEVELIGNRVTVLRAGETVASFEQGKWQAQDLVRAMSGAAHSAEEARENRVKGKGVAAEPSIETKQLRLSRASSRIDVTIRRGEVVGLAGLEGHGQEQFLLALAGIRPGSSGEVVRFAESGAIAIESNRVAARNGIAYLPRDRRGDAIFGWMPIRDNFAMPTLAEDKKFGLVTAKRIDARLNHWREALSIKFGHSSDAITTLSGGNQQKVILARWLAAGPSVLLLNDPTRGIDINAKRDLYRVISKLADEGMSIVMLSSEIDEHLDLMDRVIVFREHTVFDELTHDELTRERLVAAYFGKKEGDSE
ncbi:sugar ABC transporter ATP-binding protein [Homoserinimonas hongtaonis]|nr:sugar ABC transporter ATP-binding protein [Salinibacterium hongtaonis]